MNGKTINQVVSALIREGPDPARLQAMLAATFESTNETRSWVFHTFELSDGPFEGGEFRQSKEGGKALLSLMARAVPAVRMGDLDLDPWGEVRSILPGPRVRPEGADAYVFQVESVRVSFQFTHVSQRLRSVALEWGAGH